MRPVPWAATLGITIALSTAVVFTGCGDGTGPGSQPANGRILFSSPRGDPAVQKQELYSVEPDGSDLQQLTHDFTRGYERLRLNAARDRVVFNKVGLSSAPGVYYMNGDGTGVVGPFPFEDLLALSPDGSRLLGIRVIDNQARIAIGSLDTGELTLLPPLDDLTPIEVFWSPRGDRLGLVGRHAETQQYDLYTMSVDGTGLIPVTRDDALEERASWSADGVRMAFTRHRPFEQLYTFSSIRPDGSGLISLLLDRECLGAAPAWSPDGRMVTCVSARGQLSIVNVRTGEELHPAGIPPIDLSWSPDGTRLLAPGARGVVTANPDGSGQVVLAPIDAEVASPVWLRAQATE